MNQNGSSKNDAKDLLLKDYDGLTQSLSESEKIGETRVNWFVGVVTTAAAAFVALVTSKDHRPTDARLQQIAVGALVTLLVFGVMTLLRIRNRNKTTDGFKTDLARIRRIFRDHFEHDGVLKNYRPFQSRDRRRNFGGLADMVASLNGLLAGGLAVALLFHCDFWNRFGYLGQIVSALLVGLAAFMVQDFFLLRNYPRITHAGGVVYRVRNSTVQYLLVGPKKPKKDSPKEWLLPKGHIERHEKARDTALREVTEETGEIVRVICPIDTVPFEVQGKPVCAKFYLMEEIEEGTSTERRSGWFSYQEAHSKATYPETRQVLEWAEAKRSARTGNPQFHLREL
jgi:ADP-ribose pyrophosphatase YjhB (NUDIX family)